MAKKKGHAKLKMKKTLREYGIHLLLLSIMLVSQNKRKVNKNKITTNPTPSLRNTANNEQNKTNKLSANLRRNNEGKG